MQRYGAHEVDYPEFAPAPFEVFEDLLPMDAGCKELQAGACGAGASGSVSHPYLEGGIEEAALFGGRHRGGGSIWGAARGWVARERRVGGPGLQGGAFSQFWSVVRVLDWGSSGLGRPVGTLRAGHFSERAIVCGG